MSEKKKTILDREERDFYSDLFDKNNNLIDYFLEIGIPPKEILQEYFFNEDDFRFNDNLVPQKISQFPEYNKKSIMISPESIINHIFPIKFECSEQPKQEERFSIILDNQLSSATYLQKYITCILFYEPYSKYIDLSNLYLPNSVNENLKKRRAIYIPKCICFVSVHPFLEYQAKILDQIYQMYKDPKNYSNCFINRVIEKIVTEVPYPPRGDIRYSLTMDKFELVLENRRLCDLPLININLKEIIEKFDAEQILCVLRSFLLEKKIVFISSNKAFLTNAIYAFCSFIFPLKYQFQISSILPKDYYELLENVTPFIFGINESNFNMRDAAYNEIFFIIDLGKNVKLSPNFNPDEQKEKENFPDIPKGIKKPFLEAINKIKRNGDTDNEKIREVFFNLMLGVLENYNKYLKNDYMKCHETKKISVMLNLDSYIASFKSDQNFYRKLSSTQMFIELLYQRLTPKNSFDKLELLLFEEKMIEKAPKGFFSKKPVLHLLGTNEFNFNENVTISLKPNELSEVEINYFKDEQNIKKSLLKGIQVKSEDSKLTFNYIIFPSLRKKYFYLNKKEFAKPKNINDSLIAKSKDILGKSHIMREISEVNITESENDIYLTYIYLWALTFYWIDESEKYYQFIQLMNIVEKTINLDVSIMEILFRNLNNFGREDLILILYKRIIANKFTPSMEIFDLITQIYSKKSKSKRKGSGSTNKNIASSTKTLTYQEIYDQYKDYKPYKRTFRNNEENDILTEDVSFKAYHKCECGEMYNLFEITKNELKNDNRKERENIAKSGNLKKNNWIKCNKCEKFIKANLEIQFGLELFNANTSKEKSSSQITVELLSPDVLKEEIQKMTKTENENKTIELLLLDSFKKDYAVIFWNCVWYFKILDLDISIILMKDKLESLFNLKEDFPFVCNENSANTSEMIKVKKQQFIEQKILRLHYCPFVGTITGNDEKNKNNLDIPSKEKRFEGENKNNESDEEEEGNENDWTKKLENVEVDDNFGVDEDLENDYAAAKNFETLPDDNGNE